MLYFGGYILQTDFRHSHPSITLCHSGVRTPQTLVETHRNNQPRSSSTAESLPTESASFSDHPRRIQARSTAAKSSNQYVYASLSQCIGLYIRNLVLSICYSIKRWVYQRQPPCLFRHCRRFLSLALIKNHHRIQGRSLWRKLNGQHSTKCNQQFLILN